MHLPGYQPTTEGNQKQIRLAAKALANARRPVIYAGGGVVNANAAAELTELVAVDRFPVTCTLMGLGAFPAPHEQWLGMLGMHGTRAANYAMDEADLIFAVGARFDDRITGKLSEFAPRAKFIHIDVDPAEISKNVPAHIPIVGDAKNILAAARGRVPRAGGRRRAARRVVGADRAAGASATRSRYEDSTDTEIKPQYMVQALYEATGGDCDRHLRRRPAPDVGRAVLRTSTKPRRWINSGGLGTMGFGLPAAMGAQVGLPRPGWSCCIAGDGSVQMNMQELATCAEYGIPIKVVRHEQRLPGHGPPVAGAVLGQALLARRHGPVARLREARRGLRRHRHAARRQDARWSTACKEAIATEGPVVVDVRVTREENSYPMIPRGPGRAGHGGLSAWASREPRSCSRLEELEAAGGIRTGRKHILSILVENKPGVLTRIAGLFARRGFNIDTLAVGPTDDEAISRITLTSTGRCTRSTR